MLNRVYVGVASIAGFSLLGLMLFTPLGALNLHAQLVTPAPATQPAKSTAQQDVEGRIVQEKERELAAMKIMQGQTFKDQTTFIDMQRSYPGLLDIYLTGSNLPLATSVKLAHIRMYNGWNFYEFDADNGDAWYISPQQIGAIHISAANRPTTRN